MKIINSNIVTCFSDTCIGTKVIDKRGFDLCLIGAINSHDFDNEKVPGQGFIRLSKVANKFVSGGVGNVSSNPEDYIIRKYRESVGLYLKREFALPVTGVSCVVYTKEAYLKDPDVINDPEEYQRVIETDCTHVLVAVLADCGVPNELSCGRFVANLAGGNLNTSSEHGYTLEQCKLDAKRIWDFSLTYKTVSD